MVREVAVGLLAVSAVAQYAVAVIVLGRIDDERTNNGAVIAAVLSVGMESQAEVDRRFVLVHPQRPTFHVVLVLIAVIEIPYRGVNPFVLQPIARTFCPSR